MQKIYTIQIKEENGSIAIATDPPLETLMNGEECAGPGDAYALVAIQAMLEFSASSTHPVSETVN